MKPWEENWDTVTAENVKTDSIIEKKPWEEDWGHEAEINVVDYNGTYLVGNKGQDVKPFEKMKIFMDRLFTFKVKTGDEVAEKYKNNKNIQAAEKIRNEGFDDVEWGEVGKSVVRGTFEIGRNLTAEPLKIYGDWLRDDRDVSTLSPEEADKVKMNNFTADSFSKVGGYIEKLWNWGLEAEWLKEDEKIFAGDFVNNPSMTRVLSLGASAIPSLGFGGGITKITGSPTLAAVMLSGADSADIYWGAREAGKGQNKALGLFAAGTAGTTVLEKYGLDTIYDKKIMPLSKRIVTSVLSEGLTEGTQTAYQNMVRKYGYDDTQLLMEGVIESIIGGAVGGGVMSTAYGGYAKLRQARENLSKKGLEDPALDVIQEGFAREFSQHRDMIEPLFQENINKSLNTLEKFVAENEGTAEAQKALQTKQELEQIYGDVFDGLKKAGMDENTANADAKIWQGIALFGSQETGLSPAEYIRQRMPKIKDIYFSEFRQQFKNKVLKNDYSELNILAQDIARIKRGVSIKKNKGLRLSQFLKQKGGIKDDRGDIKAIGSSVGLLNKKGISLDEAARIAWDAGYIRSSERPDINTLLDLLSEDLRNKPVYTFDDEISMDDREYYRQLEMALDKAGVDLNKDNIVTINQKLKEYQKKILGDENVQYNKELDDFIPFQLPAEAYNKQGKTDVDSEAFKRWFGDSKVVDENGQPLVVYHGTHNEFEIFDKGKLKSNSGRNALGDGFYFTSDEKRAERYAYGFTGKGRGVGQNNVMAVYLDIRNPAYSAKEFDSDIHDGIIDTSPRTGEKTYLVVNPNQIKSVNNRGTFNSKSNNIYYQGQIMDNGQRVELSINSQEEMQGINVEDFKNKMLDTLKSFKGKKIFNQSLNGDIEIRTSSIKKYKSFFADKNKRLIVPYIPELLEKAKFDKLEASYMPNRETNVKAYYKADLPINIDNDTYNVHLTVKEDNRGNLFWDAQVKEKSPSADPATNPGVKGLTSEISEDGLIIIPNRENVNYSYQELRGKPKGAYMENLDRNGIIYLFEKADASTFMHESAHFFRKELQSFDTARSRELLKKVEEWENQEFDKRYKVKEENGRYTVTDKTGNVIYGAEKPFFDVQTARDYARNELFARGFEQYLREGKAPNNYLKQAFRSFWNWLRHLYKTAADLDADINDDIRAVYGDIIGGKDLDFYLSAPVDEVLQQHFAETGKRKAMIDEQIRLAQAQPVKRGFAANLARERTDGVKGRNEWWNKAVIPISTRAKRVNIKLRNRLRAYDYNVNTRLNQYYAQIKPFLDKWATMTETDAVAFDLALKNGYVEKQLEIVNKYGAYDEFVAVKNLLNSLFDQAIDVGIELGYTADYFPRQIEDVEGFMRAVYGSPFASQLRRALKEADPDNVMTNEQKAEFFNKYLRGFNRKDLNKPLPGNVKDRSIDIVTAEMNKYYKPSIQALINYIEGMNASIESRRFWGFKYDDINQSIGALTADLVDTGIIKPEQDAEVQDILRARFKAKGVTNKWLNLQKNVSYIYTMGGINSAITQLDDISMSLYKAGFWNTVQSVFSKNRPGLSREELGLERIGQEFVEASTSSTAVNLVFKATGLDKIDAFGKNTLINATFNKFQKMAKNNEAELRARIEPVMEQETVQTIEDIKNGIISDNVKLLMFNELADVQPIALSEMPEWYLTSGNGRVLYMLKTFMIKRWDIFRNECYDKIFKEKKVREGIQNLFRLSVLMMLCGASKDAIIDMMFGRDFDVTDTMVNNFLGLFGLSKYTLYKTRDEGFSGFAASFAVPPVFALYSDLLSDIYKSLFRKKGKGFNKKGKAIKDYEVWKGVPLGGRFYYWWLGGGKTKQERKKKKKLK